MGINFGFMLAGSVLVETVFSWPGLGRLLYDAITGRDYTTVMGMLIIISTMVMISNLIVDIAYAYIDPRISHR
jgi:ABC-type dipeptide/oligopeptide/nickel transport system permease component